MSREKDKKSRCMAVLMLPPFTFSMDSFNRLQNTFNVIEVHANDLASDAAAAWATA
jgi:hypothetical protein